MSISTYRKTAQDISTKLGMWLLFGDPYISIHFAGQDHMVKASAWVSISIQCVSKKVAPLLKLFGILKT